MKLRIVTRDFTEPHLSQKLKIKGIYSMMLALINLNMANCSTWIVIRDSTTNYSRRQKLRAIMQVMGTAKICSRFHRPRTRKTLHPKWQKTFSSWSIPYVRKIRLKTKFKLSREQDSVKSWLDCKYTELRNPSTMKLYLFTKLALMSTPKMWKKVK